MRRRQIINQGLCPAQITGASKNKTGESLSIAAVRGDVQHLVRLGSGLFDLAVNRFAKGGDSLPDGRRLGQIRSLGRLNRVPGEFSRLLQMASVGFRVCLRSEERRVGKEWG